MSNVIPLVRTCTLIAAACTAACESAADVAPPSPSNSADAEIAGDSPLDRVEPEDASDDDSEGDAASSDTASPALPPDAAVPEAGSNCPLQQVPPLPAGDARSTGYTGTDTAYFALYGQACMVATDCAPACVAAGGTPASCSAGAECLVGSGVDGGLGCLPPTYWMPPNGALSESNSTAISAELILVGVPYEDTLVLTRFRASVPDDAVILGVRFDVRRATLVGDAVDDLVLIVKDGHSVGANHASPTAWPLSLTYAPYGGAYDTWGLSLAPSDLRNDSFGVAITPKYTGPSAGNERAYIDSVRLVVYYTTPCD